MQECTVPNHLSGSLSSQFLFWVTRWKETCCTFQFYIYRVSASTCFVIIFYSGMLIQSETALKLFTLSEMHYVQLNNMGNVNGDGDIKPNTVKSPASSLVLVQVDALAIHSSIQSTFYVLEVMNLM